MVMPVDAIHAANEERLRGWGALLTAHGATAAVLLGVGQRPENLGTVLVVTPDEALLTKTFIAALLRKALRELGG
jgi:hypothetical protein